MRWAGDGSGAGTKAQGKDMCPYLSNEWGMEFRYFALKLWESQPRVCACLEEQDHVATSYPEERHTGPPRESRPLQPITGSTENTLLSGRLHICLSVCLASSSPPEISLTTEELRETISAANAQRRILSDQLARNDHEVKRHRQYTETAYHLDNNVWLFSGFFPNMGFSAVIFHR